MKYKTETQYDENGNFIEVQTEVGGDMFYRRRDPNEPILNSRDALRTQGPLLFVLLSIFATAVVAFFFAKIITIYNAIIVLTLTSKLDQLPGVIKSIFLSQVVGG